MLSMICGGKRRNVSGNCGVHYARGEEIECDVGEGE